MEPLTLENGVSSGEIGTFDVFFSLSSIERPEVARNICAVNGDNAIGERMARK